MKALKVVQSDNSLAPETRQLAAHALAATERGTNTLMNVSSEAADSLIGAMNKISPEAVEAVSSLLGKKASPSINVSKIQLNPTEHSLQRGSIPENSTNEISNAIKPVRSAGDEFNPPSASITGGNQTPLNLSDSLSDGAQQNVTSSSSTKMAVAPALVAGSVALAAKQDTSTPSSETTSPQPPPSDQPTNPPVNQPPAAPKDVGPPSSLKSGGGEGEKPKEKTFDDYVKEVGKNGGLSAGGPQTYTANMEGFDNAKKTLDKQLSEIKDTSITEKDRKDFKDDLARFERTLEEGRRTIGWAETFEIVGAALVRLAAANYGLKHKVDAVSGTQFTPTDWSARRKEITDDARRAYDIRLEEFKLREREVERNASAKERLTSESIKNELERSKALTEADYRTSKSKEEAAARAAEAKRHAIDLAFRAMDADRQDKRDAETARYHNELNRINGLKVKTEADEAKKKELEKSIKEEEAKRSAYNEGKSLILHLLDMKEKDPDYDKLYQKASELLAKSGYEMATVWSAAKKVRDAGWVFKDNEGATGVVNEKLPSLPKADTSFTPIHLPPKTNATSSTEMRKPRTFRIVNSDGSVVTKRNELTDSELKDLLDRNKNNKAIQSITVVE
jgi:hypothetical protein